VSWVVSISGEKRVFVTANARAWREQVTVAKPLSSRQPVNESDITVRRQLLDILPPDGLLTKAEVLGQAAARDLKPGMVFTSRTVQPQQMVRAGQDVMLDTASGGVRLLTGARALSDGTMGQTVRLRNEQTREIFMAVVTGPKRVSLATSGMAGSVR
jgi:flagella basal body P-ring formation protein FlgA